MGSFILGSVHHDDIWLLFVLIALGCLVAAGFAFFRGFIAGACGLLAVAVVAAVLST